MGTQANTFIRPDTVAAVTAHILAPIQGETLQELWMSAWTPALPAGLSGVAIHYYLGGHWDIRLDTKNTEGHSTHSHWMVCFALCDATGEWLITEPLNPNLPNHVFLRSIGEAWAVVMDINRTMRPMSVGITYGNSWTCLP